ncbi:MAG: CsbD family protein [Burkholderiaceae bacterium]
MNNDQVKGRIDQAVGKVKEETGELVNDKELEVKGRAEKNAGKLQAEVGNVKEKLKDGIDKL